jgi:hypothetical protein
MVIKRLDGDGRVDYSFGRDGEKRVGREGPFRGSLFVDPDIEVTPEGRLVVGAKLAPHDSFGPDAGDSAMVAFRYLADGRPDRSFGRRGYTVIRPGFSVSFSAFAARPGGGLVLAGDGIDGRRSFVFAALRPDGGLDPAFGRGGITRVRVAPESYATALVLRRRSAIAIGYSWTQPKELRRTLSVRVPLSPDRRRR